MGLAAGQHGLALARWLCAELDAATVEILRAEPLSGGAIQDNWALELRVDGGDRDGTHRWILRADAPASIAASHGRMDEFRCLQVAHEAGLRVPEPIAACDDATVIGRCFYLMQRCPGTALGPRIVKQYGGTAAGTEIAREVARQLALLHAVAPADHRLDALGPPPSDPAGRVLDQLAAWLDELGVRRPALEWGLRWARLHAPTTARITWVHRDLRTGNFLVNEGRLSCILDWEFSGWGDPHEDLGWFCARCWRFSRPDLEAGGLAPREVFLQGYEAAAGFPVDRDAIDYWELVAHIRWAVIALQQADRHRSGREPSLELGLIEALVPGLEVEILGQTGPSAWRRPAA